MACIGAACQRGKTDLPYLYTHSGSNRGPVRCKRTVQSHYTMGAENRVEVQFYLYINHKFKNF